MDDVEEAYFEACLRFADACHGMSEAHEKGAEMGFKSSVLRSTILSGFKLAVKWEKLCLDERIRHCAKEGKIKEAENNIRRLEGKIKKYGKKLSRDNEFENT